MKSINNTLTLCFCAAAGIALKPIIQPIVHAVSSALFLPGGAFAGGFYMMWLTLSKLLVKRFGSASFVGLLQGLIVMILGFGSHGVFSLVSYTLPGLMIDLLGLIPIKNIYVKALLYTGSANIVGTLTVAFAIMNMPYQAIAVGVVVGMISATIAGVFVGKIYQKILSFDLQ